MLAPSGHMSVGLEPARLSIIISCRIADVICIATRLSHLCQCLDIQMWDWELDEIEDHRAKPPLPLALMVNINYQQ